MESLHGHQYKKELRMFKGEFKTPAESKIEIFVTLV